jgi:hypothetical protein
VNYVVKPNMTVTNILTRSVAFASLPKLPAPAEIDRTDSLGLNGSLSRSTEELLKLTPLPPRPEEMTPDREAQILKSWELASEPHHPGFLADTEALPPADTSRRGEEKRRSAGGANSVYSHRNTSSASISSTSSTASQTPSLSRHPLAGPHASEITRLHKNFRDRLQPFWARMLNRGRVRVSIYTMNVVTGVVDKHLKPLSTIEIPIVPETGYFGTIVSIPFDAICEHAGSLHIAFGDQTAESHLTAIVEYIPPPPLPPQPGLAHSVSISGETNLYAAPAHSQLDAPPPPTAQIEFALSDARVRLISDIDDTIKISSILLGVRAVFRNVFVRHLDELACPGMPGFYNSLSSRGVRFHYVVGGMFRVSSLRADIFCINQSNSPFELLPVLSEFIKVVGYPAGECEVHGREMKRSKYAFGRLIET